MTGGDEAELPPDPFAAADPALDELLAAAGAHHTGAAGRDRRTVGRLRA